MNISETLRSPRVQLIFRALGLAVVYFAAGRAAIALSQSAGGIVPLWPSSAILLATLLRSPTKTWPYYIVACYFANIAVGVSVGDKVLFASGFALADTFDVIVAGLLMRKFLGLPLHIVTGRQQLKFLAIAAALAPVAGASWGACLQVIAYGDPYLDGWITWWISSAVGMLIVAPLWLELEVSRLAAWWARVVPLEVAAMLVTTAVAIGYIFSQQNFAPLFLITPLLLWSAMRAGRLGVAGLNLLVMIPSVWLTVAGMGPIAALHAESSKDLILFLQFALGALALPPLLIATLYEEQLRNEQQLKKTVRQLNLALEIAQLSHWEWDAKTDRLSVSLQHPNIFVDDRGIFQGLSDEDYVQQFVHPDDRTRVRQAYGPPDNKSAEFDLEYRIVLPDGEERIVHEIARPVYDETGQLVSQWGTIQNVTEKRLAEQKLREKDARLRDLLGQLARVTRITTISGMSAAIVHELSQPMTVLLNAASAGRRLGQSGAPMDGAKLREILEQIALQVERMDSVIRTLRDLHAGGEPRFAAQDINEAVQEACAVGMIGARDRDVSIQFDLEAGLHSIAMDKLQIQQVIINLLRNAIEASADSPQRVITLSSRNGGDGTVRISVSDTGPGLPESVKSRLFQPFVTSKSGGMGIGLSVSWSIVEAHGGKLWAEPNPEGGTVFHLSLPLDAGSEVDSNGRVVNA